MGRGDPLLTAVKKTGTARRCPPKLAAILAKLSLADRAKAVVLAYETGLVQPGENDSLLS